MALAQVCARLLPRSGEFALGRIEVGKQRGEDADGGEEGADVVDEVNAGGVG